MTDMTTDPNPDWLDEERRGRIIYGRTIHSVCSCKWDTDHLPDEPEGAMYVMRERDKRCVIHGAKGWI